MAETIAIILLQAAIGVIYSLLMYKAGKFGEDAGKPVQFNAIKMIFIAISGAVVGGYLAYTGVTFTPDSLASMLSLMTVGGFGVVALIDIASSIIAGYLFPDSKIAQGFAVKA
jgi:hypothetical protein